MNIDEKIPPEMVAEAQRLGVCPETLEWLQTGEHTYRSLLDNNPALVIWAILHGVITDQGLIAALRERIDSRWSYWWGLACARIFWRS